MIPEPRPPRRAVAELEPAGKRRPEPAAATALDPKHATMAMAALLAVVLAGTWLRPLTP